MPSIEVVKGQTPPWAFDTPSLMPAQLVDVLTYAQYQFLVENDPEELKRVLADTANGIGDAGFSDAEAIAFLRRTTSMTNVPTGLVADATKHTGAMIALVPSDADIERLAVPGGESADDLHLTICYLGEATKIPPYMQVRIREAMRRIGQMQPIVDANGFGIGVWNGRDSEKETAIVLNVGGGELEDAYEEIWTAIKHCYDHGETPEQYEPWSPHVCLAYSNDIGLVTTLQDREGPISFTKLRIAFAGQTTDIPLYDGSDLTSPGDSEMDDEYETVAAAGKKESDVNLPGGSHNLRNYWTRGAGAAKIRWGTDGSFARCVTQLSKYVTRPQGLCAEYHHAATGQWPTEGGKHGIPSAVDIGLTFAVDAIMPEDLVAAVEADQAGEVDYDGGWEGVLAVEDIDTGDQRRFAAGSITWPDPQQVVVPLQWAPQNNGEHKGSVTVGRINEIWRDESNPRIIRGRGVFDIGGDNGAEAFRQVREGFLAGTSIDPDQVTDADVELIYSASTAEEESAKFDDSPVMLKKPELTVYHAGRIRGATLVAFPAFIEGAIQLTSKTTNQTAVTASVSTEPWKALKYEIALGDEIDGLVASAAFAVVRDVDDIVDRRQCRFLHHEIADDGSVGPANLVACTRHIQSIVSGRTFGLSGDELRFAYDHLAQHVRAAGSEPAAWNDAIIADAAPTEPPLEWFVDPQLHGPTPVTVTDDGRVYGHAAVWGTCHTGYADTCVTPPRENDYSFFTTGEVVTAGGQRVAVGQITLGTSHAPTRGLSVGAAVDHYGNTGTAVADVTAGVDDHGIWVAGAVRPGTTIEHIHALRASALSGDWRRIGGSLRMVALLAVNVPGFPIPRVTTAMQDKRQLTLVAAGIVDREHIEEPSVDFNAEVLKLAGSCGIPLGSMPKKKKMTYADELELMSLQIQIGSMT